jgi:hypothetical protein
LLELRCAVTTTSARPVEPAAAGARSGEAGGVAVACWARAMAGIADATKHKVAPLFHIIRFPSLTNAGLKARSVIMI